MQNQIQKRTIRRGEIYYVRPLKADGSLQQGVRPAVIIGNDTGNKFSTVHAVVYITSQQKNRLPTHVNINLEVPSTILCEHPQSVPDRRIKEYVRTLSDQEMKLVNRALRRSLAL